jgi:hypothetical protein
MNEKLLQNFIDPNWRLNNLYTIVDKNANKIPFKTNSIQQIINRSTSKRKMILKARQFGVSTNEIIKMCDYVFLKENITACIIAHEQDSIKKLFRIVHRCYDSFDPDIRPQVDRGGGSKYELFFPQINSRIYCDLESRGDTINWLHISEAAFVKDQDKLIATMQAVPMNGIITLETTPNGMGNFFFDWWQDEKNNFEKIFLPWYLFSDYKIDCEPLTLTQDEIELKQKAKRLFNVDIIDSQINFRRFKQNELKHLFIQEYPEDDQSCFLASGNTVINLEIVKQTIKELKDPISETEDTKIFKLAENIQYVCGVDTAEGVDGDYSVATIFDAMRREQVAILRSNVLKPHEFAKKVYKLCELYKSTVYNWPLLAVECNNHGHAVLLELNEHLNYPNLYEYTKDRLGWKTDSVTRPIMLDAFINGVENKTVTINDDCTLKECYTFINNNGKIEAAAGKHDDCIIACSIAIQMCQRESAPKSIGKILV